MLNCPDLLKRDVLFLTDNKGGVLESDSCCKCRFLIVVALNFAATIIEGVGAFYLYNSLAIWNNMAMGLFDVALLLMNLFCLDKESGRSNRSKKAALAITAVSDLVLALFVM